MAALIPTPFDWSRLIIEMTDESFGIPPHVIFQIVENGSLGQLHEVKAHKMILGMVSPTFRTMFYSTDVGDKTTNVIKIEKTTSPAFQITMDAVYNVKSILVTLEGKSVHEVFDVEILVQRYQIVELMESVKKHLINYPITDDTVLEVAGYAMEYNNMFEAEAEQLLLTCAKLLRVQTQRSQGCNKICLAKQGPWEIFAALLALMNDIAATECPNYNKEICQDGEVVKKEAFREGLLVTNNRASDGYCNWRNCDLGTGTVTMVGTTWISVDNIGEQWTYSKSNNSAVPNFLFRCN